MRRLLLRLLLLAVCFHTALALPLHQGEHIRADEAHVAGLLAGLPDGDSDDIPQAHAACVACVAHAALALPPHVPPAALPDTGTSAHRAAPGDTPPAAAPRHRPGAPRAPPRA